MAIECFAQVRGRVVRVTRLDACGNPDPGASAVAVTDNITKVTLEVVTDEGTNIRIRNFEDRVKVKDDAFTDVLGLTMSTTLCLTDPGFISVLTGQPVVMDDDGNVVGFDMNTGIDLDTFGFAMEVWSRIPGAGCDPNGHRKWGYTVLPFLKGGRLEGFSFENGLVEFSISGAQTRDGNGWGVGPYDVTRDKNGAPTPLFTPLGATTVYRNFRVSLDPPAPVCGTFALAS